MFLKFIRERSNSFFFQSKLDFVRSQNYRSFSIYLARFLTERSYSNIVLSLKNLWIVIKATSCVGDPVSNVKTIFIVFIKLKHEASSIYHRQS